MMNTRFSGEMSAIFARDLQRLCQEIDAFPDTATLWKVVPGITNSAGTLAIHLEGNLRDFIGRELGGVPYVRDRKQEFGARDLPKSEIVARLTPLAELVPSILASLPENTLEQEFPQSVLGISASTRQFLLHLLGHLNYHLGQIDYVRRALTGDGAVNLKGL